MLRRMAAMAVLVAACGILLSAVSALGDTCCANKAVAFRPSTAVSGQRVDVDGIACLDADNSGPLALNLVSFWLSTDRIPADSNPGDTPGNPQVHPARDLPPTGRWLPFSAVRGAGIAAAGSASLTVPAVEAGSYQLWWLCDNGGGPGSGIHYSGGPRLHVGPSDPDTATPAPDRHDPAGIPGDVAAALLAGGVLGWLAFLARMQRASRAR